MEINGDSLKIFHSLVEDSSKPICSARLLKLHVRQLVEVIDKINNSQKWLPLLEGKYFATELFHESNDQRSGIITRFDNPSFQPNLTRQMIVSGPHFYVGTPLNRTARKNVNIEMLTMKLI